VAKVEFKEEVPWLLLVLVLVELDAFGPWLFIAERSFRTLFNAVDRLEFEDEVPWLLPVEELKAL